MNELDGPLARLRDALLAACGLGLAACTSATPPAPSPTPEPEPKPPVFTELEPEHEPATPSRCESPSPILLGGSPSGYVECADGAIDRVAAQACANPINAPACAGTESHRSCETHADCTEKPSGFCMSGSGQIGSYCSCIYPCLSDEGCGPGMACVCPDLAADGPPASECVPAACTSDADCPDGSWAGECGVSLYFNGCWYEYSLQCRGGKDTCRRDADCQGGGTCGARSSSEQQGAAKLGPFECLHMSCVVGRPLTVAEGVRVAAVQIGRAWGSRRVDGLPISPARARHWLALARMEHASVASFARFVHDLLALGAPPALIRDAAAAAADEVRHAQATFALSSAYVGAPAAPGPLRVDDLAGPVDLPRFVTQLIREGCVGETVGVAEALALLAGPLADPVRRELERIAADEARHAALAWRTLRWIAPRVEPEVIDRAFGRAIAEVLTHDDTATDDDPAHGRLGARARHLIRSRAIAEVVEPCRHQIQHQIRSPEDAAPTRPPPA